MAQKPFVLIKFAMSLDGFLDDATPQRLILSGKEDFERVDIERARCDAILVGANTLRKDNPKLTIKSEALRNERIARGLPAELTKVTITDCGDIPDVLNFFQLEPGRKIVFCCNGIYQQMQLKMRQLAEIELIPDGQHPIRYMLGRLYEMGIHRLLVEGGKNILTQFIGGGYVDEMQISIAPFFVGMSENQTAPRFLEPIPHLFNKENRLILQSVEQLGDMVMLTYVPPIK